MKFVPLCLILVAGSVFAASFAASNSQAQGAGLKKLATQSKTAIQCPDRTGGAKEIGGIALGMSARDAILTATCNNKSLVFNEYTGYFESKLVKVVGGEKPVLAYIASTPSESIGIRVMGAPGSEAVVGVARELRFRPGTEPTMITIAISVGKKFPMRLYGIDPASLRGVMVGNKQIEGHGWLFNRCVPNSIAAGGGTNISIDPTCGLVSGAYVELAPDNADIVRSVTLIMTSADLYAAKIEDYNRWARAQNLQVRGEQNRRASGQSPRL